FLVQSLGGTAPIRMKEAAGQPAYRMSIALPDGVRLFRHSWRAEFYHPRAKDPPSRAITSVTYVGRKPAQCIAVDSPDHLYVTDDFIVTHNTAQAIIAMRLLFHGGFLRNALVVCPKPLVLNWSRELLMWAPDIPFEIVNGDTET